MQKISNLSLGLCVISIISSVIFSILPDTGQLKNLFKTLSGFISTVLILTCVLSLVKGESIDLPTVNSSVNSSVIEDYIVDKNTQAYLLDVKTETESIFKKSGIRCSKISVHFESDEAYLQFEVNKGTDDMEQLTRRLYECTKIKCKVIVDGYDE